MKNILWIAGECFCSQCECHVLKYNDIVVIFV